MFCLLQIESLQNRLLEEKRRNPQLQASTPLRMATGGDGSQYTVGQSYEKAQWLGMRYTMKTDVYVDGTETTDTAEKGNIAVEGNTDPRPPTLEGSEHTAFTGGEVASVSTARTVLGRTSIRNTATEGNTSLEAQAMMSIGGLHPESAFDHIKLGKLDCPICYKHCPDREYYLQHVKKCL